MFFVDQEPPDIFQEDIIEYIVNVLGKEIWVPVFLLKKSRFQNVAVYAALYPINTVEECLTQDSWDTLLDGGFPGCEVDKFGDKEIITYHRFGSSTDFEAIAYYRDFHGIRPSFVEVSEEFRLFHNLYEDKQHSRYIRFDESGNEEDAIRIDQNSCFIKTKAIKQFLAIREMSLVIYYEIFRFSEKCLNELNTENQNKIERNSSHIFSMFVGEDSARDTMKSMSCILGKKIISGMPKEKCGIWPFINKAEKAYEDFVIGVDENGDDIVFTCDPDQLANYFGKNPSAPHYLTPVFFRKEVLSKYYNEPHKYSVEDGYLRCGGLWGVRIDNNRSDFVVAFLGDLGRDMLQAEQLYWKSYNVPPEGGVSKVCFERDFQAQFTDPSKPDLFFKQKFEYFTRHWFDKKGWHLFLPLKDDEHHFTSLRIPLTDDDSEFDAQILSITKVIIESINDKRLKVELGAAAKGLRSIEKLDKYLSLEGLDESHDYIDFFKDIYSLRGAMVHRKGKDFKRMAEIFGIGGKSNMKIIGDILDHATQFIIYLDRHFFPDKHEVDEAYE